MKKLAVFISSLILPFSFVVPAYAHVVVNPNQVGVAERTNFSVSVPTEEDVPTVGLRLVIPQGLQSVRPNVKPGWTIEIKKEGTGEDARVTEITWTGGSIPADQRDEFVFSAQAPAKATTLQWKAYQTYEGGEVVSWDADPEAQPASTSGKEEDEPHPYSETQVINDLTDEKAIDKKSDDKNNDLLVVGVVASFIMSSAALWMQSRKNNQ